MEISKLTKSVERAYRLVEKLRFELWTAVNEAERNLPPEESEWKDNLIEIGTAEIINGDVVKIHIPKYFPHIKELINKEYKEEWKYYIKKALSRLEKVPMYDNAFVFIEIHTIKLNSDWDTDNKAISLIINSIKGTLFKDDSFRHLSYAVKGYEIMDNNLDIEKYFIDIYIMDYDKYIGNVLPFIGK